MSRLLFVGVAAALLIACGGGNAKIIDAQESDGQPIDGDVTELDAGVDAPIGHPGTGTVTGAVKASSQNYTLYGTLRSGDGSSASPQYQRRGGITGATQP